MMNGPQNEEETNVQNNYDRAELASIVPKITGLAVEVFFAL